MKVLVVNRRWLMWLNLCPADENSSINTKLLYTIVGLSVFIMNVSLLVSSSFYFKKFIMIDLEQGLYALGQIVGFSNITYMIIAAFLLRVQINSIFENLSTIYDENSTGDSSLYLLETSNKCEWMCKIYIKFCVIGNVICTITLSTVSVLFCYINHGEFNADFVYHPLMVILPWNQQTLFGYMSEICFQTIGASAYFIANGSLLMLFISMCLHHRAFYKMFQNSLQKLNSPDENRNDEEFVCKLIRFHVSVKDWFLHSSEVYSLFVLVQLILSMILMAECLFQLDLQFKHPEPNILFLVMVVFINLSNLFIYCFFGKMATQSFVNMADCLFESNWRNLDIKLQKYLVIMIANAQRPIYYHGFGVATLNLETFASMIRAVLSYYMAFKTITS